MESTESSITVKSIETKESKAGKKYWSVSTVEQGNITCFEENIIEKLKEGEKYLATIATNEKGFKNLREIKADIVKAIPMNNKPTNTNIVRPPKTQSMYVSYAKDIFLYLLQTKAAKAKPEEDIDCTELMNKAVKLLEIPIKAF